LESGGRYIFSSLGSLHLAVRHNEIKMTKALQLILFLLPTLIFGQGFLPLDTLKNYPPEISDKISGPINMVLQVDFNGDNKPDYIVKLDFQQKTKNVYLEYWLTSDFKIFKKKKRYRSSLEFFRFVNIDQDIEPEIFSALGYEDGIDYAFYDLDLKTGKEKLIFYFNPVIINNDKEYWGYPWDIEGIYIKNDKGVTMLYASVNHNIERDGNVEMLKYQKIFPVIFFKGHSIQKTIIGEKIRDRKWLTIEKIKKLCLISTKDNGG